MKVNLTTTEQMTNNRSSIYPIDTLFYNPREIVPITYYKGGLKVLRNENYEFYSHTFKCILQHQEL